MRNIQSACTEVVRFVIADTEELIREAKNLCHDVYLQVGYISEPYSDRIIPYDHENSSTYLVAVNSVNEVIGTLRLTQGPPLRTLDVWRNKLNHSCIALVDDALQAHSFEIGALAVRKDCSPMRVSFGLYKAAWLCSRAMHLDYAVISMDCRALRSMEMQGWRVIRIGEPMYYFGSMTVPAIIPINEQPLQIALCDFSNHVQPAA